MYQNNQLNFKDTFSQMIYHLCMNLRKVVNETYHFTHLDCNDQFYISFTHKIKSRVTGIGESFQPVTKG